MATPPPPLFLSHRLISGAALTTTSEVTNFPVANLKDPQPSKAWRIPVAAAPDVTIDLDPVFGSQVAVDTVAMVIPSGVGLPGDGTFWRIRGATSQANLTSAPGYDSGTVSMWPSGLIATDLDWKQHTAIFRLPSVRTFRWWRIDTDRAPFAYTQYSVLLMGVAIRPSIGFGREWEFGDDPADVVVLTPYGRMLLDERDAPRVKTLPFKALRKADAITVGGLGDMLRERGTAKPFLTVTHPDATTELNHATLYGTRIGPARFTQPFYGRYALTLQVRELL